MLFLSSILLRLSWNTRNIFEDLGPLRDSIHDVIISDDVDIGCMIIRLTSVLPLFRVWTWGVLELTFLFKIAPTCTQKCSSLRLEPWSALTIIRLLQGSAIVRMALSSKMDWWPTDIENVFETCGMCQRKIPIYMKCTIRRMNRPGKWQSGHTDGPVPFLVACIW